MHTPEACYRGGERLWKLIWLDDRMKRLRWEVIDGVRERDLGMAGGKLLEEKKVYGFNTIFERARKSR